MPAPAMTGQYASIAPLRRQTPFGTMAPMKSKITARQIVLIVFGVLVAMAVANYDKLLPHSWKTYAAPDGSFSIEFPGQPTVETKQSPVEGGATRTITMVSVQTTSSTVYTCTYFEDETLSTRSPDDVLESARDGSLNKTQGTVITQSRLTVQGYPALEMQARARGNSLLDSRMILAGKRLYMVMAVATTGQDREAKTVRRVIDSFRILKN